MNWGGAFNQVIRQMPGLQQTSRAARGGADGLLGLTSNGAPLQPRAVFNEPRRDYRNNMARALRGF